MRISRKAFAFVLGVVLAFAVTEQAAKADIIYTYTGNDFTNVGGDDLSSTSDFISGWITFASPLPDNSIEQNNLADSVISWGFTDQVQSIDDDSANTFLLPVVDPVGLFTFYSSLDDVYLATDASGNINQWSITATIIGSDNGSGSYFTSYIETNSSLPSFNPTQPANAQDAALICVPFPNNCSQASGGLNDQDPGVWTETSVSSTPEPSTTVLVSLGGSFLLIAMKRKRCTRTKKLSSMGAIVRCK